MGSVDAVPKVARTVPCAVSRVDAVPRRPGVGIGTWAALAKGQGLRGAICTGDCAGYF